MYVGNVPSRISIRPSKLVDSGMGGAGSFFSDIVDIYRETNRQKTSVALSQSAAVQAQANAAAQIAASQAKPSTGIGLQTQLAIGAVAVAGVLWMDKRRRR